MSSGGSFRRNIRHNGSQVCCDGGADVFSQNHRGCQFKRDQPVVAHNKSKSHGGTGGLDDDGQDGSDGNENQDR